MVPTYILRAVIVASVFVAACQAPTQPAGLVTIRPAGTSFDRVPRGEAAVLYTVANDGAASARLTGSCGDDPAPSIERRTGDAWAPYGGGICLAVLPMGAVVLSPGAALENTVRLAEAGEYRLVLATERGPVTSTAFTIR